MTKARTILPLVAVVAALILAATTAATALDSASASFEAESMFESRSYISVVDDSAASPPGAGQALRYTDNGPATKYVSTTVASTKVVVRARAPQSNGSPNMRVLVDGVELGTLAVNTNSYADYEYPVALEPGFHTVAVRAGNATSNRSLFADVVTLVAEEETTATPPPEETTATPPPPPSPAFDPGVGMGAASACDKTLQAGGNVETFANSLASGERGCLRAGTYTTPNSVGIRANGATLAAYPGERAEIRASFRMRAVQGFELEGVYVDASYAPLDNGGGTEQAVDLHGSTGVVLDSVVLTNQGGSCVWGGTSRSALITHSLITTCGAHGVYGGDTATGLAVRHSWIEGVVHSCQKMTHAVSNHHYYGVVCNKNANPYEGMIFNATPTGNVVENSVVTGLYYPSFIAAANYAGSNNFVRNNCLYPAPYFGASNVRAGGNVVAYPRIAGFTVTNPTCAAKLPADSPFRPASPS